MLRMNPIHVTNVRLAERSRFELDGFPTERTKRIAKLKNDALGCTCIACRNQEIQIRLRAECTVRHRLRCECDSFQKCKGDVLQFHLPAYCRCFSKETRCTLAIVSQAFFQPNSDGLGKACFKLKASEPIQQIDRKSTRLNSSHLGISY